MNVFKLNRYYLSFLRHTLFLVSGHAICEHIFKHECKVFFSTITQKCTEFSYNMNLQCYIKNSQGPPTEPTSQCELGHFLSMSGQCLQCSIGSYQDDRDSATCKPCPWGTTTLSIGATNIGACCMYCMA